MIYIRLLVLSIVVVVVQSCFCSKHEFVREVVLLEGNVSKEDKVLLRKRIDDYSKGFLSEYSENLELNKCDFYRIKYLKVRKSNRSVVGKEVVGFLDDFKDATDYLVLNDNNIPYLVSTHLVDFEVIPLSIYENSSLVGLLIGDDIDKTEIYRVLYFPYNYFWVSKGKEWFIYNVQTNELLALSEFLENGNWMNFFKELVEYGEPLLK